jgi:hypothetical protein
MMNLMRGLACSAILMMIGCSSAQSPRDRATASELAQVSVLKRDFSGIVMGFDVRDDTTLIVSLDLQSYIGMDDDAAAAMQRTVVARWRDAWVAAHPGAHAMLQVRFIDFIGRKIAEQSIRA